MCDYTNQCSDRTRFRWHGPYGQPGTSGPNGRNAKTERGGTKGIARLRREQKREEALARQASVDSSQPPADAGLTPVNGPQARKRRRNNRRKAADKNA